jgi:hypothetical protein
MKNTKRHQTRAGRGASRKLLTSLAMAGMASGTSAFASTDYGPAIWRPAYSGHWYTSGYGHKFHVIHDIEGYYASTITYFQQSGTQASVHYCVNGKKDTTTDYGAGEVTQMVLDVNYAWHARCWNQHSTGTEHEGFASNPAWYTPEMYQASAGVTAHCADRFGFARDRNHVVAHGQKSVAGWPGYASANLGIDPYCNSHTDPGPYWDWNGYMALLNPPPPPPAFVASAGSRMKGDFNGDGKEDVVVAYDYGPGHAALFAFISSGSGFAGGARWWEAGSGWEATRSQWVAGDFNGDGKSDVACLYNYGGSTCTLWVFLSTGSSFANGVRWWNAASGWEAARSKIVAGDFNADGKSDIAIAYDYGSTHTSLFTFLSSGSSFSSTRWWDAASGWEAPRSKWVAGDFNGDGKCDVAALYNYGNSDTALFMFGSNGSSFTGVQWWRSGAGNWDWTRSTPVSGNFNGDTRADVAIAYDYGSGHTALFTLLSSGAAFSGVRWWDAPSGWEAPRTQWVAGDFNGDGKCDISALYNYGNSDSAFFIFPSTGSSFPGGTQWWRSGAGNWEWTRSTAF